MGISENITAGRHVAPGGPESQRVSRTGSHGPAGFQLGAAGRWGRGEPQGDRSTGSRGVVGTGSQAPERAAQL